jgi:hypothetical protein
MLLTFNNLNIPIASRKNQGPPTGTWIYGYNIRHPENGSTSSYWQNWAIEGNFGQFENRRFVGIGIYNTVDNYVQRNAVIANPSQGHYSGTIKSTRKHTNIVGSLAYLIHCWYYIYYWCTKTFLLVSSRWMIGIKNCGSGWSLHKVSTSGP